MKISRYIIGIVLVLTSQAVLAELLIGVVNIARVMEEAPQAEAAVKRLEGEFAPQEKKLKAKEQELKKSEERLSRDAAVMSEKIRGDLERQILKDRRELKRDSEALRDDFNLRRNEERAKLNRLVVDTIRQLAKEGNYDLILTEGILFASEQTNITQKVVSHLKALPVNKKAAGEKK